MHSVMRDLLVKTIQVQNIVLQSVERDNFLLIKQLVQMWAHDTILLQHQMSERLVQHIPQPRLLPPLLRANVSVMQDIGVVRQDLVRLRVMIGGLRL